MPSDKDKSHGQLTLPALRGTFGDWTYYAALLPLSEFARRVSFATELQKNRALSQLIQRALKGGETGGRAKDISKYLRTQRERFFNSLVVAVFDGSPEWFPVRVKKSAPDLPQPPDSSGVLGALSLNGQEQLFAVDGQHRLAGMKRLVSESASSKSLAALADLVPVLFIAHRLDDKERTRRLFTTLNKTAVPVSKMERIALDENDAMALIARRLVEENAGFVGPRIAMNHTNNLGADDDRALTTIGNLYDILRLLFVAKSGMRRKELEYERPTDSELDQYYSVATKHFRAFAKIEPSLAKFFLAKTDSELKKVCASNRSRKGGSVYFRPIGLYAMTEVAVSLIAEGRKNWVNVMSRLPRQLSKRPFAGTIWTPRSKIDPTGRVLCRNVLLYMCGQNRIKKDVLRAEFARALGKPTAKVKLPDRV